MTWLPLSAQEQNDPSRLVGIGYKSKYYTKFQDRHPSIGWLEIHAENYMIDGGPRKKILKDIKSPVVILKAGVYNKEIKDDIIKNINPNVTFWE